MQKALAGLSLCLFVVALLVYVSNGRSIGAGDTLPTRALPFSLLRERDFALDEFPALYDDAAKQHFPLLDGIPYFLRYRDGHYLSAYSPAPAIMALPVYLAPVLAGVPPTPEWLSRLEKLSAAIVTALSVVLLFRAVSELAGWRWALVVALTYAFGTSSLSVSSQALWQHGPSQLFLTLALYFLARSTKEERRVAWAGLALGAAVAMRATNAFIAIPVGAVVLYRHRRVRLPFLICAVAPLAAQLAYYLVHFRAFDAGLGHSSVPTWAFFSQTPLLEGLLGILFSPARGLFVYSPVLVFSLVGIVYVWRRGPDIFRALSLGVLLAVVVAAKWFMWWGGHSYGPRLLADLAPVCCFLMYPLGAMLERRVALKAIFGLLAALSIGVHALGFSLYDGRWDALVGIDRNPSKLWSWREGPIVFYAAEAMARFRQPVWAPSAADPPRLNSSQHLAVVRSSAPTPAPMAPELERLLAEPLVALSPATVSIATDQPRYRRAAVQSLRVELRNPSRPQSVRAYLALRGGDGTLRLYDGHALASAELPWKPWVRDLPLPAKVTAKFSIPLRDLPSGDCSWYVVLAEPEGHRVIARASTAFTVER